jgi:hypothetical protein
MVPRHLYILYYGLASHFVGHARPGIAEGAPEYLQAA